MQKNYKHMNKEEKVPLRIMVDADLKYQFRLKTMQNKTDMTEEVVRFIQLYLKK